MPRNIDDLANFANNQVGGITANHIMRFPTSDVEPVRHAHWIYGECGNDKYIKCSFCRKIIVNNIVTLDGNIAETSFVLCPYCGAKMGGGD